MIKKMENGQVLEVLSCKLLPLQEDEEPGMPSFEMDALLDGKLIQRIVSIELEGRDVDCTDLHGEIPHEDHWEICNILSIFAYNSDTFKDTSEEYFGWGVHNGYPHFKDSALI